MRVRNSKKTLSSRAIPQVSVSELFSDIGRQAIPQRHHPNMRIRQDMVTEPLGELRSPKLYYREKVNEFDEVTGPMGTGVRTISNRESVL
jgi:hypothetical protein